MELSGVLNINKPSGMTSHDVVDVVRRLLKMRRVGHTGTLDPRATGVLPLCIGRATRIAQFLTQADKEYLITMRLGITTDTLDADGKVLSTTDHVDVDPARLREVLDSFVGEIQQVPPLFSAKKHHGERLYRLARRGETVERQPIAVRIHELTLLECDVPFVRFRVSCSKGTYARTLCDDVGRILGCGAHLYALTRVRSGRFLIDEALTLEQLEQAVVEDRIRDVLIPIGEALGHLPMVRIHPESSRCVVQGVGMAAGALLSFPVEVEKGDLVRVLGYRRQLLSLAEATVTGREFPAVDPRRIVLRPVRVLAGQ
ncbi:MAG: tRNA pseudouridine(55) synthase TruB [Candidatus Methylomirabilota bacterium]|nr:tRNA pseudouridine(55) synthase TruB [candidate division NC10 bacterium]PWB44329.1 MAG: tRNA pseudouridine(55) synthase TruB [candidate division NC10 bacterium]